MAKKRLLHNPQDTTGFNPRPVASWLQTWETNSRQLWERSASGACETAVPPPPPRGQSQHRSMVARFSGNDPVFVGLVGFLNAMDTRSSVLTFIRIIPCSCCSGGPAAAGL